jgi:dsDNA-binding SOS-regulon protein
MAVVAMWKCDRDDSMFDNKKDADAYDKMLELGEQFTMMIESQIKGVDERAAEAFGLLLAKNKELLMQACKGRPEALAELVNGASVTDINEAKVTAL